MKLKSCVLIPCLLTGGTEISTLQTAEVFASLGYDVDVIVYYNEIDPVMLEEFRRHGIAVHLLNLTRKSGILSQLLLAIFLVRVLARKQYVPIWVQYMTPTLIPLLICRFFSRVLIAQVHVSASHYETAGLRRIRWFAQYWCTRFICVSETTRRGVLGTEPEMQKQRKTLVIPNSVDIKAAEVATRIDWRLRSSWSADTVIIGYIGRLSYIKGLDILLKAAAGLKLTGLPIAVVLVGDGEERSNLDSMIPELGLSENVLFAGRISRDQVFAAIKGFDIVIVPSREEGFGLSAVEAMACGVPLVASRVDALEEIISDGETGLLFAPEDFSDLENKINLLINDAGLRRRLGISGAENATRNFGENNHKKRIADFLRSVGLNRYELT